VYISDDTSPLELILFNILNVVAPVAPSGENNDKKCGFGQTVICTGNEINKNTRPTNAGLKILQPIPPKHILATIIDINEPINIIQQGIVDGKLKANNKPVITAE
jgi:hypothetical protein